MLKIVNKGSFKSLDKFFVKSLEVTGEKNLNQYMNKCIEELANATPKDTGLTSRSWNYTINKGKDSTIITINNTNVQNGLNIALLLEFGHGTRNGAWIEGKNYIEPVVYKTYMEILNKTWKEVEEL